MQAEAIFNEAAEAYAATEYSTAAELCDQLLLKDQSAPNRAALLNLKALSLAGMGLMFAALECAEKAVETQNDHALLWHHCARLRLELGRDEQAEDAARTACRLEPDNLSYRYHLAVVFMRRNDIEKSVAAAMDCLHQDPSFAEAGILLSEIALASGNLEQAIAHLQGVVGHNPGHERGWGLLADLQSDQERKEIIRQALERIHASDAIPEAVATAGFALANMDRRDGHFALAFAQCESANQLTAKTNTFDIDDWQKRMKQIIDSPQAYPVRQDPSSSRAARMAGENLLFIVGMPRSGTSLTEQILSAHPLVRAGGENPVMEYIENELRNGSATEPEANPLEAINVTVKAKMRQRYLDSLPTVGDGVQKITDKAPRNFERLGLIFQLFPRARVLWCTRHPLDIILSCYFQDFGASQGFSTSLLDCAKVYAGQVRLMRHWMKTHRQSIDIIDYAMLVQNLEASARGMADFAGLDFHPAMVEPHRNPRPIRTASYRQVKRPVYTSSLNNWRHYPDELADVRAWLEREGLLDHLGRSRTSSFVD